MYDILAGLVVCKIVSDIGLLGVVLGFAVGVVFTTQYPAMALAARQGIDLGVNYVREAGRRVNEAGRQCTMT